MKNEGSGVLTIAYGAPKYLRMGRALALSLRHHSEETQLAVVTNTPSYFDDIYDHIIPVDLSYGSGVTQKLYLDCYTPFEETLFIDSDCLLYGSIEKLWEFFSVEDGFGVRSMHLLTHGDTCQGVSDFDRYLDHFNLESLPNLKGGFYYFNASGAATKVFEAARDIYDIRDEVGLTPFKNAAVADEAVIGTALALCGIEPLPHEESPVNTFLGRTEPVEINVLKGKSRFVKNGTPVKPKAIHYPIGTQDGFYYLRDVSRLELREAPMTEFRAQLSGALETTRRWMRRKSSNVRNRVREMGPLGILPGRVLRRFGVIPELGSRQ